MTDSSSSSDRQLTARSPEPSGAEIELLRRKSIHVLASVADALQAAFEQRKSLLAEVQAAEATLHRLVNQREMAESSLSSIRAQVNEAVSQLELVRGQRAAILSTELASIPTPAQRADSRLWTDVGRQGSPLAAARSRKRAGGSNIARAVQRGISRAATGSLIAVLFALVVLLTPLTQVFGGLELLSVMSGSMEPTIHVGGIVAIRPVPPTDLKVGDAITFVNQISPDVLVTHRIVSLELRDGQTMLTTKGDANDSVDALSAPASRAVGRVEFSLPYLGYLMVWLSSPLAKVAILGLAVLGLGLASVTRSSTPAIDPPDPAAGLSYLEHEREIQALLGH